MRIAIFGSTGRTGNLVVKAAAGAGLEVTAFTRRAAALDRSHVARFVEGDGRDRAAVANAVRGADAVVAIVSSGRRKGPHVVSRVVEVMVDAMIAEGVGRLIATAPYGPVATAPRLLAWLVRRLLAEAFEDSTRMERLVTCSTLDWTILRLPLLNDEPSSGELRWSTSPFSDGARPIPRIDAAKAIMACLVEHKHSRTAINVSAVRAR